MSKNYIFLGEVLKHLIVYFSGRYREVCKKKQRDQESLPFYVTVSYSKRNSTKKATLKLNTFLSIDNIIYPVFCRVYLFSVD